MTLHRAAALLVIALLSVTDIAGSVNLWRLWPTHHGKPVDMTQTAAANDGPAQTFSRFAQFQPAPALPSRPSSTRN